MDPWPDGCHAKSVGKFCSVIDFNWFVIDITSYCNIRTTYFNADL